MVKIKMSVSETLKYFFSLFQCGRGQKHIFFNTRSSSFEKFIFYLFLIGQYLTSLIYGFLTYYAFPETWHEQASKAIFVAVCTAVAIALGKRNVFLI